MTEFRTHLLGNFTAVSLGLTRKVWATDQFCRFMKAKASLTLEYSQKLEKLAQKFPPTIWFEETGLAQLWTAMVKTEEDFMHIQATLAKGLNDRVHEHLNAIRDTSEQFRKNVRL